MDLNFLRADDCYKNLNKHENCSKCNIALTRDNYKKGRRVRTICYTNQVLTYYRNMFCSNSSPKSDVSTQTEFSNEQDISNKQVRSSKLYKSKNKLDIVNYTV